MLHENRFKYEGWLNRTIFRLITTDAGLHFDKWLFRWTTFSFIFWVGAVAKGVPYTEHLMLTTTGAKTGLPRDAILPFFREGDEYVIIASNAGSDKDPGWIANIRANPNISVRVSRRLHQGLARIADSESRNRLYARACQMTPIFNSYQENTKRVIPVVLLKLNNI